MILDDKQQSVMRAVISSFVSEKNNIHDMEELVNTMFDDIYMDILQVEEDKLPKYKNIEGYDLSDRDILNKRITIFTRVRLYSTYSNILGFINNDSNIKRNYRNLKYNANKVKKDTGRDIIPRRRIINNKINDTNTINGGDMDKTIREDYNNNKFASKDISNDPLYLANPSYANWLSKKKLKDTNENYIIYIKSNVDHIDKKGKKI